MPSVSPDAWFTANLLALVLAGLTFGHLVRQRQEPGAVALMIFVGSVALRAVFDLIMIGTGSSSSPWPTPDRITSCERQARSWSWR